MAESNNKKDPDLKQKLNPMQYRVTQECGTEPPFQNEYWNNHKESIEFVELNILRPHIFIHFDNSNVSK